MTPANLESNRKLTGWTLWVYRRTRKWPADNDPNKWNDMLLTSENNGILTVCLYAENKN